jgi:shikimate dehydrogenase
MIKAGVIGYPIAHSRSPMIHGHWLKALRIDGCYDRYEVLPDALAGFISGMRSQGLSGCNCTLPHKEAVMALSDDILPAAQAIGAANTLWFEEGRLMADNTDALGYAASLDAEAPGWDRNLSRAVVLGAGGAARAVLHALLSRGAERILLVNRTLDRAEALAAAFGPRVKPFDWSTIDQALDGADFLVNTTSLGMKGQAPLKCDATMLHPEATVSDIVYVPLETPLVATARESGRRAVGGLGMLLQQAVPGFAHWFGQTPQVTPELRQLVEADIGAA